MALTIPNTRQLSDETLEALRLRAVRACTMGLPQTTIADALGVARETVCRWWNAYLRGGLEALPGDRTGRPTGSGRLLDDDQARHLQALLDHHTPEQLGVAAPLWTRRAVRDLIHREYGWWMPVRTVGEYLARWGYTSQRPGRHARGQDADEVREWLDSTYPEIEARAAREGADIHWGDETGLTGNDHPGRGYARVGQTPELPVSGDKARVNLLSTVTNDGELHFQVYTAMMTAALFLGFLERLVAGAARKVFLIVDPLPAHVAVAVQDWVWAHEDQIELFTLPAKTPERNPVEYLNNDLKGNVYATGLPKDRLEMHAKLETFMHYLASLPERIRSYFRHPMTRYAAADVT
jgi:transposase